MADCIKKMRLTMYCLQGTHFTGKDKHRLRVQRWKITFGVQVNGPQKQAEAVICISYKVDIKQN
jgi:hypothetical protein